MLYEINSYDNIWFSCFIYSFAIYHIIIILHIDCVSDKYLFIFYNVVHKEYLDAQYKTFILLTLLF